MKKLTILIFVALGLAGCKKTFTCECTRNVWTIQGSELDYSTATQAYNYKTRKSDEALKKCQSDHAEAQFVEGNSTIETDCVIK